jgi:hypothetical protein
MQYFATDIISRIERSGRLSAIPSTPEDRRGWNK